MINLLESRPLKEETTKGYSGSGATTGAGTTTRKGKGAKAAQTATTAKGKSKGEPATKAPAATSNGHGTDKQRMALARKVVAARDTDGLSWLKIGAKFNLAPGADSAKAGASRARTLYRLIKGEKASTGPLIRK